MLASRHFVSVGEGAGQRFVHYTRAGSGPPVLLLHASATSSGEMALAQGVFARDFTAIAFDTPGYGLSEPLRIAHQPEIEDYADALAETVAALGLGKAAVYGRHTGASIAVEFGKRHPARCTMVLTDGYPIWTAAEREAMLGGYLPELHPSWEGAHLLWAWFRYRDQHVFWPWFDWRAAKRATRDVPSLEFVQRGALEFLQIMDGYRVGYSAAFRHDGGRALEGMTVPVCLGTRASDLIHAMRDRAPPGAWTVEVPGEPLAAAVMERGLLQRHEGSVPVAKAPACGTVPGRAAPDFRHMGVQYLIRETPGEGQRTLVIPEVPGSTDWMVPMLETMAGPVLAFDLPGLGESEPHFRLPMYRQPVTIADWAVWVMIQLDVANKGPVRVYGHRGGCSVAVALALLLGDNVSSLVLDSPLAISDGMRDEMIERYAPEIGLEWDGSHMTRVWHHLRDQEFWWPWYERTQAAALRTDPAVDPAALTVRAVACLRQPERYREAWQAVWRYDLLGALARVKQKVTVAAAPNEAFGHLAARAAAVVGGTVVEVPDDLRERGRALGGIWRCDQHG